jgi:hypothetical protein
MYRVCVLRACRLQPRPKVIQSSRRQCKRNISKHVLDVHSTEDSGRERGGGRLVVFLGLATWDSFFLASVLRHNIKKK